VVGRIDRLREGHALSLEAADHVRVEHGGLRVGDPAQRVHADRADQGIVVQREARRLDQGEQGSVILAHRVLRARAHVPLGLRDVQDRSTSRSIRAARSSNVLVVIAAHR
jgi:hypothetical protein